MHVSGSASSKSTKQRCEFIVRVRGVKGDDSLEEARPGPTCPPDRGSAVRPSKVPIGTIYVSNGYLSGIRTMKYVVPFLFKSTMEI